MNITIPRDVQTRVELMEIAAVKYQLISPLNSRMVMMGKQDQLSGNYNLTNGTVKIGWKQAMNILANTSLKNHDMIQKGKEYTGHELFSAILPKRLNLSNGGDVNRPYIKNGELISGKLGKATLAAGGATNLVQLTMDEYDNDTAMDLMNNIQKISTAYHLHSGFSVGIDDTTFDPDINAQIQNDIMTRKVKAARAITDLENNPGTIDLSILERNTQRRLANVRSDAAKLLMSNLTSTNAFGVMIRSGAKGNEDNLGQISGCLAQQEKEGKRPQKTLNKRALPYFFRNDDTADARGFIGSNFMTGLKFSEFFFHNMGAREGMIDSAIKTAESGYTQRKLIKAMEDLKVAYDCTIRTANNGIVQFIYGDSGADTTKQYSYDMKMLTYGNKKMESIYKFTGSELQQLNISVKDNEEYFNKIINMRDALRISQQKAYKVYNIFTSTFMLPVNINRIIDSTVNIPTKSESNAKLTIDYITSQIDTLCDYVHTQILCMNTKGKYINKKKDDVMAKRVLNIALHHSFAPKRCLIEYKLNKESFDKAMNEIAVSFCKNLAEPGEMIGIIAAQSICQPLTQMTLNTFHHSGIGAKGTATLGVPRFKEIFGLSKNMKTPQMALYLTKEYMNDKDMAHKIAAYVKYTTIEHLRKRIDVFYDPFPGEKDGFMEKDHIENVFYSHKASKIGCQQSIKGLPWLMRIEFDREKLLTKEVTLLDIKSRFCNMWERRFANIKNSSKEEKQLLDKITQCAILSNTDNDDVPVVHIRFDIINTAYGTDNTNNTYNVISDFIDNIIDKFKLKGFEEISKIEGVQQESVISFNNADQELKNEKEYTIYTSGINMYAIRYIYGVDNSRVICNDIITIYEVYGVEAARAALLYEIMDCLSGSGNSVNYHHLSVLVDLMTRDGIMISIDRHGMGKTDVSPLARASFERTVDQLITAATFNEIDQMRCVSTRIMAGHVIRGGTGMCDIILDSDMIEKSEYIGDYGMSKSINTLTENTVIDDVIEKENNEIFIPE